MTSEVSLEHLSPLLPPEDAHQISQEMLARCPIKHSDVDGGFWFINRHADILQIMQDPQTFASGSKGVRVPHERYDRPYQPPIDSNPPLHRSIRAIENPYLSSAALAKYEQTFREIIGGLISNFASAGHCDIAKDLAQIFPSLITFRVLLGLEDGAELNNLRGWVRTLTYGRYQEPSEVLAKAQNDWSRWCREFIARRRMTPREDIVGGLINGTVTGGRPLTDDELVGAVEILIFGGFQTTADATCSIVLRLIQEPELEAQLRQKPEGIPLMIEETLRLDPPVATRPRVCTEDVEIGGTHISTGDRVLCNYLAANIDPTEWENPLEFRIGRRRNRVMTFGVGPHRCLGSNLARMTLKIMVEELLYRVGDIGRSSGTREVRTSVTAGLWRSIVSLPVTFSSLGTDGSSEGKGEK
jgi:cytochrome P450